MNFGHCILEVNVRYVRKAEVQGLQKRGAQHVQRGQAMNLSATYASASWERRSASGSSIFFSLKRSGRQRGDRGNLAFSELGSRDGKAWCSGFELHRIA
jgi:hypothetical protein